MVIKEGDQLAADWQINIVDRKQEDLSDALRKIAIGFCLFVNSVNVELVEVQNPHTKKHKSQGRAAPLPYFLCKLETKQYTGQKHSNEEAQSHHSYQYDVRGHFRTLTKYKDRTYPTPRTLWVPPHRRGLASGVYRPKIYDLTSQAKPPNNT